LTEVLSKTRKHIILIQDGAKYQTSTYQRLRVVRPRESFPVTISQEPSTTGKVIAGIQKDGVCWCGGTIWQEHTAMRLSVSSWATTDDDDVELSLESMLRVASKHCSSKSSTDPHKRGTRGDIPTNSS
jgi:hypothetical protein